MSTVSVRPIRLNSRTELNGTVPLRGAIPRSGWSPLLNGGGFFGEPNNRRVASRALRRRRRRRRPRARARVRACVRRASMLLAASDVGRAKCVRATRFDRNNCASAYGFPAVAHQCATVSVRYVPRGSRRCGAGEHFSVFARPLRVSLLSLCAATALARAYVVDRVDGICCNSVDSLYSLY